MIDSIGKRWLLAIGAAILVALAITAFFSRISNDDGNYAIHARAAWKARTGVDLAALPQLHPDHPDSADARALDVLLAPIGLHLGGRTAARRSPADQMREGDDLDALRDTLRASIRSETTDAKPLPPAVVSAIEKRASTLDEVANWLASPRDLRWREDAAPRAQSSVLYVSDHLILHRLLIGRAFLALERNDRVTAARMLDASRRLNRVLEQRRELISQFIAVGVERLHLALLRRAGEPAATATEPPQRVRERYLAGMSAEAALVLASAGQAARDESDPSARVMLELATPKLERAASEAVTIAAEGVQGILRETDGCAALARPIRRPRGMFAGNFHSLNPSEAWRRFVVLDLDRAITQAVLTGRASSPCSSVAIRIRDEGNTRTVEVTGLPGESENVISLPAKVTTRLDRARFTLEMDAPVTGNARRVP